MGEVPSMSSFWQAKYIAEKAQARKNRHASCKTEITPCQMCVMFSCQICFSWLFYTTRFCKVIEMSVADLPLPIDLLQLANTNDIIYMLLLHCIIMRLYLSQMKASQMLSVDTYRDCLRTLHTQAVVEPKTNFVPNRVLGASPPDISPLETESLLPRSVCTTLAQLCSGHCQLLNSYKALITSSISDVCPECGVAPHSIEHLFNCQSRPTQLTVGQPGCGRRLPQPGQLMIGEEMLGYHISNNDIIYSSVWETLTLCLLFQLSGSECDRLC